MDDTTPSAPERRSRYRPLWWALAFSVGTSVALVALAWGIWMMHALSYGFSVVMSPGLIAQPDGQGYGRGLAVGIVVALGSALLLVWLAAWTPARKWHPAVQGLVAATSAAVVGASALLLMLGISPVDFLMSL